MSLVFLALNLKLLFFFVFFWLCVKVVSTCKIHALLLTNLLGQFIELQNTQFFKILENLTWTCIVLFFSMKNFEKLVVTFTLKSIYMKEECGLKKHTDMYMYTLGSLISVHPPPLTFFSKNFPTRPPLLLGPCYNIIQCIVFDFVIIIVVSIFISNCLYHSFKTLLLLFISVWW